MTQRWLPILVVWAGLGGGTPAWAQPSIPAFTGSPILATTQVDRYDDERVTLQTLSRRSERGYYGVVVPSTHPDRAAEYLDRLVDRWQSEAASFDPERDVVTLVAVEDRAVSMLAGADLRRELGLTAEVIDRELVEPYFAPRAREGDLGGALVALAEATEQWIRARAVSPAPRAMVQSPVAVSREPSAVTPPSAPRPRPEPSPWLWLGVGLVPVAAVGGLWWFRVSRHRRAEQAVRQPFAVFSEAVVGLLDRIEVLSRSHELLPFSDPDYEQPMAGKTAALYDQAEQEIRELRQTWLELMGVHDRIKLIVENHRRLTREQIGEVGDLLGARERLDHAQAAERDCEQRLQKLEQAHEEARALREEAAGAMEGCREQRDNLATLGLPTAPYQEDFNQAGDWMERAEAGLVADPLEAAETYRDTLEAAASLAAWLSDVRAQAERRTNAAAAIDEANELATRKREGGMLLLEEEGNPDPMIVQGRHELEAAWMALTRGDGRGASGYLDQAEQWAEDAVEVVQRQEEARQYCEAALDARSQRAAELGPARDRAASARETLRSGFAAESWHGVADSLERADQILEEVPTMLERAREDAAPAVQRYFHAEDLLIHIEHQQEQGAGLLAAVGQRLEELQKEQAACAGLREDLAGAVEELRSYLARNRHALGADGEALASSGQAARVELETSHGEDLPHWPMIRIRLQAAIHEVREALRIAGETVKEYEQTRDQLAATERDMTEVGDLLRAHQADRIQANRLFEDARVAWESIRREAETAGAPWDDLRIRLREVGGRLDRARDMAQQDISLARQAQEAIREAEREIQRARSFYQAGARADTGSAARALERARDWLRHQAYESALETASEAEREAQDAVSRARRLAREKKRAIAQRRMAQTASVLVQAAASYAGARAGSRHHASRGRSRRPAGVPPIPQRPTFPSRSRPPRSSQSGWGGSGGPRSSQSSW